MLSGEIVDITSQYNEENELIEVIALLSPTVLKRARVEIFTLPLNIISGKNQSSDEFCYFKMQSPF